MLFADTEARLKELEHRSLYNDCFGTDYVTLDSGGFWLVSDGGYLGASGSIWW